MADEVMACGASVLLSFRASNSRSFREEFELSLLATGVAERECVRRVPWRESGAPVAVLPVAAIFGANGSGKSNVLKAMDDMRRLVLHSFRYGNPSGGVTRRPFLLDPAGRSSPTRFVVDLVLDGVRHEYGFSVDDDRVLDEWAYRYPKGRAALLFQRHGDYVEFGSVERAKGRALLGILRPNALLLSTAAAANHSMLLPLYQWFSRNLLLAEAGSREIRQALTAEMLDDARQGEHVLALLQAADLGVVGATLREPDPLMQERMRRAVRILSGVEDDPDSDEGPIFEQLGVRLTHRGVDSEIELEAEDESLGTRVWFGLIGPVVSVLEAGSVFLADELDASLHPALVSQLVRLFQDPATNPNRAQLIVNSHEASLLPDTAGERLLGRDQIWFTEKRSDGTSTLYPLVDFGPRKQEAVGRRYMAGRYGGTPILSHDEFASAVAFIGAGDR